MKLVTPVAKIFWLAVLLAIAALALFALRPPKGRGLDAPPNEFSAARAISVLQPIAERPHPLGSEENARVRQYLLAALRNLGAEIRVEETAGSYNRGRLVRGGRVTNIVATIRGSAPTRALMLAAHYDSVPEGPGAADDGAGVSVILETLRALRSELPLRNDLLILISDGEEAGLLGASGFAADHPELSAQIGVVLNLEARGSSGPVLMFETSEENGWLIKEFARAAAYPMGSSLLYSIYKTLPNDTDLTPLKRAGLNGFNFAFMSTLR